MCEFAEVQSGNVNQAAIHAKLEWTGSKKGATNVFDEVNFIHDKAQVRLACQRSHILDGDPLPENPDSDDGTPTLFPHLEG